MFISPTINQQGENSYSKPEHPAPQEITQLIETLKASSFKSEREHVTIQRRLGGILSRN